MQKRKSKAQIKKKAEENIKSTITNYQGKLDKTNSLKQNQSLKSLDSTLLGINNKEDKTT